jgi:hypothetical protein
VKELCSIIAVDGSLIFLKVTYKKKDKRYSVYPNYSKIQLGYTLFRNYRDTFKEKVCANEFNVAEEKLLQK